MRKPIQNRMVNKLPPQKKFLLNIAAPTGRTSHLSDYYRVFGGVFRDDCREAECPCFFSWIEFFHHTGLAERKADYAVLRRGKMLGNSLNLPVAITRPTSGRCPSLPLRLHKEKGDETLIFIAFL